MKKISAKYIIVLIAVLGVYILHAIYTAPEVSFIKNCPTTFLHKIMLCSKNPNFVSLNEVSDIAIQAILISEDSSFYQHKGFDYYEIVKSCQKDFWKMHFARGGSTISQQVVKNIFLSDEKSIYRKIQEAFLTIQVEKILSKAQILENYINLIELGPNIFGLKQASEFYFHKKANDLTILESAYLAHLLPNPKRYSKSFQNKKLTKFNRSQVLNICKNLWHARQISASDYLLAQNQVDDFPWG